MRKCTVCKQDKPLSEYHKWYRGKDGHRMQCKSCRKTKEIEYALGGLKYTYYCMMQRCYNPNNASYEHYGRLGITVCERWRNSIQAFIDDMGPRPEGKTSIGRIDNTKGYSPENCRWEDIYQQNRNKGDTKLDMETVREIRAAVANGAMQTDIARSLGINITTINNAVLGKSWPETATETTHNCKSDNANTQK